MTAVKRAGKPYTPEQQLREAEIAMTGADGWCSPYESGGVWLSAPAPYKQGFIAGLTKQAAEWQLLQVRRSVARYYDLNSLIWA